jgi:hypothetical protein
MMIADFLTDEQIQNDGCYAAGPYEVHWLVIILLMSEIWLSMIASG